MNDVIDFLLTKEVFVIFLLFIGILIIYFVVWFRDYLKKMENRKILQNNTLELNRLVEETKTVMEEETLPEVFQNKQEVEVVKQEEKIVSNASNQEILYSEASLLESSPTTLSTSKLEADNLKLKENDEVIEYKDEVYTEEEAKQELERITEELQKEENMVETLDEDKNITLTEFEIAQEENAIISLEELLMKGKELTSINEISQYEDEGNEPISIEELEKRYQVERFEKTEEMPAITPEMLQELDSDRIIQKQEQISLFDMDSAPYQTVSGYKPSPIISPIFGIEKDHIAQETRLELENTANYEKLDAQLQKTNEFLARLRELQNKLD